MKTMEFLINKRSIKLLVTTLFTATIAYTWHGILQLGMQGGPCNAGIAWIVLFPSLLICVICSVIAYSSSFKTKNKQSDKPLLLAIISLILWTFWLSTFYKDSPRETLLYLGPFELLNMLLFSFLAWKTTKIKKPYLPDEGSNIHSI